MINVAVVGVGWWGQTLITLMKKSPRFRVVKGVKRNPATVAEFARAQSVEIATISALEAIIESAGTGRKVMVK